MTATLLLLLMAATARAQKTEVLIITETASPMNDDFMAGLKMAQDETSEPFDYTPVNFERKLSDTAYTDMCKELEKGSYSAVVDLTWGGWIKGRKTANELALPYIRMQSANHLFVQAADDFLRNQKAVDAALIFETQVSSDVPSLYGPFANLFFLLPTLRRNWTRVCITSSATRSCV